MRRAAILLGLLLAGCGEAVDFSGDAQVPDGYETYSGQGVSFAHPKLPEKADDRRVVFGGPEAFVELRVSPGKGNGSRGLEVYVRSYVAIAEGVGKAKVETTEQEVPGADGARLLEITSPPKAGANAKELTSRVLVVDRGPDIVQLSAGTQEGSQDKVDAGAVVASFRLR